MNAANSTPSLRFTDELGGENASAGIDVNVTLCSYPMNYKCMSDEDYLVLIENYVFPTSFEWFLATLYFIVFIVGLTGNALVVYVVWRNASMRTVTNLFIVNLSVADVLVIVVCLPSTALVDITETWYLGLALCKVVHYIQGISVSVSVMTLTFLSIERYLAIVHPLKFESTIQRTRITILIIWIVSCALFLPELIVLNLRRTIENNFTNLLTVCSPSWTPDLQTAYQFILLTILYGLPLLVMTFAYVQIARRLWTSLALAAAGAFDAVESSSSVKRTDPRMSTIRSSTSRYNSTAHYDVSSRICARRNVAKMLIVVVIIFAVCYLPVHLLNICRYAGVQIGDDIASYLALIAHWLCYFNSAINPIIYNLMSARFLKSFKVACRCLSGRSCWTCSLKDCDCCHCDRRSTFSSMFPASCRTHSAAVTSSTFSSMFPASCRTHSAAVTSSCSDPIQLGVIVDVDVQGQRHGDRENENHFV